MPVPPTFNQDQFLLIQQELVQFQNFWNPTQIYSNLFLVPKRDKSQRPVINLKVLNKFVQTQHIKMEEIHPLKELVRPGDWLAKVDLKDTYFKIPIHLAHRTFLSLLFQEKTYEFNCIPFGLHGSLPRRNIGPPIGIRSVYDCIHR